MNLNSYKKSLYNYIFNPKNEKTVKLTAMILVSLSLGALYSCIQQKEEPTQVQKDTRINLNVLIPDGHVLLAFEAENYKQVEAFLEPYNMVKVFQPKSGRLIAKNIKVLRAPKDPSHLSFLVPENIAKEFINFGLKFKIVIQKYESHRMPHLVKQPSSKTKSESMVTYGGKHEESH